MLSTSISAKMFSIQFVAVNLLAFGLHAKADPIQIVHMSETEIIVLILHFSFGGSNHIVCVSFHKYGIP
jgi:hypothetical protein